MGRTVGIDFGTSNSGVAVMVGDQVRLLPVDPQSTTPEVVRTILYITRDYKYSIGQTAVETYYRQNINRRRRFVKKWVGEIEYRGADMYYVTDVYAYVDELTPGRLLQYLKTALRTEGFDGTQVFDRYYGVVDLVTIYLRTLRQRSEELLGEPVDGVTLGRPVKFSNSPEQDRKSEDALRQAALEAGFRKVSFEMEPVAAALFYEHSLHKPETVLIFDFGGGTLDITIMRLGDPHERKIFATGGIDIAGSDFDRAIIQKRMLPFFGQGYVSHSLELSELVHSLSDWMALPELAVPKMRLRLAQAILEGTAPVRLKALEALIFNDLAFSFYNIVEQSKIALSNQGATTVAMKEKNIDIWQLYTRYQFEHDIAEYQRRIEQVLLEVVEASGLEIEQIDAVVKTGGSSNIPLFNEMLMGVFGPGKVKTSNSFSSVTAGLGIRSARGMIDKEIKQ